MPGEDLSAVERDRRAVLSADRHMRELMLLLVVKPQRMACQLSPARHVLFLPDVRNGTQDSW